MSCHCGSLVMAVFSLHGSYMAALCSGPEITMAYFPQGTDVPSKIFLVLVFPTGSFICFIIC